MGFGNYNSNIIGGSFPGGGSPLPVGSGTPLDASYTNAYNSALQANKQLYGDILGGYQQTAQNIADKGNLISQGYGQLGGDVQGLISGIGSDQRQLLANQYAANQGASKQSLISRGLSNSTVADSVSRGNTQSYDLAQNNLANQIAQTKAGYMSNIGQAGLNYQGQSNQQGMGLSQDQLHWMNTISAPYPNSGQYSDLARQQGAVQQAAQSSYQQQLQQQQAYRQQQINIAMGYGNPYSGYDQGFNPYAAYAAGGKVNTPTAIVGEGDPRYPEFVIPTDPKYRARAKKLLGEAKGALSGKKAKGKKMARGGKLCYEDGGVLQADPEREALAQSMNAYGEPMPPATVQYGTSIQGGQYDNGVFTPSRGLGTDREQLAQRDAYLKALAGDRYVQEMGSNRPQAPSPQRLTPEQAGRLRAMENEIAYERQRAEYERALEQLKQRTQPRPGGNLPRPNGGWGQKLGAPGGYR